MTSATATATLSTLTANETAILAAWPNFEYVDASLEDVVNKGWCQSLWTWSFVDDAAAACKISATAVRGVIASLSNKGLVKCDNGGPSDERTITVTDKALELIVELQNPVVTSAIDLSTVSTEDLLAEIARRINK